MLDRGNVSANKCFSWVGDGSCGYFSILSEITELEVHVWSRGSRCLVQLTESESDVVPPKT